MGLFDEGERPMGVRIPSESHSRPAFQRREADAQMNGAPENHVDFESQLETPRFRILQVHEEIQLLGWQKDEVKGEEINSLSDWLGKSIIQEVPLIVGHPRTFWHHLLESSE